MSRRRAATWTLSLALLALVFGGGCAGAGSAPPGDDDDAVGGDVDAALPDASASVSGDADAEVPGPADAAPPTDTAVGAADAAMTSTPDAAPTCSPCQLVAQCGCDTATAPACDLGGANPGLGTTACRPVLVPGTTTSTCNDATSCAAGYVCLGPAGQASCKHYCAGDGDCQGGGGVCVIEVTSGGTPIPGVKVCSPSCDPFTSSGCPQAWACGAFTDPQEMRNFTWCEVPGQGGNNAACTDDSQCAAGFTCVNVGGANKCKKYCDKGDGNPGCTAPQTCVGLVDAAGHPLVVAGVTYGVCN